VWLKLAIWGLFLGALFLVSRSARLARALLVAAPFFAVLAAAIASYKPF
jgi:hypothetical protein